METIKINCPACNHSMEYWTKRNYIECPNCRESIKVEPCEDIVEEIEIEANGNIEISPNEPAR